MSLSKAELHQLFEYDPSGVLRWKVKPCKSKKQVGDIAGNLMPNGYWHVGINRRQYYLHRLMWSFFYDEWPKVVDHIDGNPLNNRIENLRNVCQARNAWNAKGHKDSKLGIKGVYTNPKNKNFPFRAFLSKHGKVVYYEVFKTIEEAATAVQAARAEIYGEFARH